MDFLSAIGIKLASSFLGAVMALVFQPPKNNADFWTRLGFSILAGILFSDPVRDWLKWPVTTENNMAAAGLTALLSWWLMGAVVRVVGAWKPKE